MKADSQVGCIGCNMADTIWVALRAINHKDGISGNGSCVCNSWRLQYMECLYSNPRASQITFIARRQIWSMFAITWLLSADELEIGCRLLWSWYAWRAYFCLSSWSLVMAGGIWERSWSAISIAWFTRLSSCRRRSRSASNLALFLKMLAWVSFRDLISLTVNSAKALKLSLCLIISSC